MDYTSLMLNCRNCVLCPLSAKRSRVVFHRGNPSANVMYIGEAPDEESEKTGEAFTGKPAQLLDRAMDSLDITSGEVLMTNVLKCRPPGNTFPGDKKSIMDPEKTAGVCTTEWLDKQIEAMNPKAIVLFGGKAAQWVLYRGRQDMPKRLGDMVGRCYRRRDLFPGVRRIYVAWSPAYLLRGGPGVNKNLDTVLDVLSRAKAYSDALDKAKTTGCKPVVAKETITILA